MQAVYDLGSMPTTFDFAVWAVMAKTHGCTSVHFINDGPISSWKYPASVAWKRFGNILVPICALAGLPFTVGRRIDGLEVPDYTYGGCERLFKEAGKIAKLEPTVKIMGGFSTITLRRSFRNTFRNSNTEAWLRFKAHLEGEGKSVVILEECEQAPLDIEYRMGLYCTADMNFGASGGPMALCHMSDAPYLTINMAPVDKAGEGYLDLANFMTKTGFPPGSQFSFRNARQKLVWKSDTFDNILAAYRELKGDH